MYMSFKSTFLAGCFTLVFCAGSAVAETNTVPEKRLPDPQKYALYSNAISDGAWRARTSVFSCSLEHNLPYYGKALFRTRAGERSAFLLTEQSSRFEPGEAQIFAQLPAWKEGLEREQVGSAPAKRGRTPMWLDADWAEIILLKLYEGMEVEITQKAWYQQEASARTRLVITPIGFRPAYNRYLSCLGSLLPANFDQMKRSAIYFPDEEIEEIPPQEAQKLDRILKIVKHDKSIRAFFVDGHTDSAGDRADNLEVSRVRAEMVANYLTRRGVPEDWITLRWHGERYPVASNGTNSGKARNRRVTVRMERVDEIEVLPLKEERAE